MRSISRYAVSVFCCALTLSTAAAQSARLTGTVTDSIHHVPLVGATVIATPVAPTNDTVFHAARTNDRGAFALDNLRPGHYVISVEHPFTDSTGVPVPAREIEISANGSATVALTLPSAETLQRALCGATASDTTRGVVLGAVRRAGGDAARGATIVFEWTDLDADRTTGLARQTRMNASTRTDSNGVYRACGLPVEVDLQMQGQLGDGEQSGVVAERIGDARVVVRDLQLGATTSASATNEASAQPPGDSAPVHGPGVIHGIVRSTGNRAVIGATVTLFGTDRSVLTNERGEFRMSDIPTGSQGFEIIAVGYGRRRFRAEVGSYTPVVRVTMTRAAVLDSVRVTARRPYVANPYPEFDQRSRGQVGQFITEADIERKHPFLTTDLLRQIHGFGGIGGGAIASNRGPTTLQGSLLSNPKEGVKIITVGAGANGSMCLSYYLNGRPIPPNRDVNEILPTAIHGIEIYSQGEAPVKYNALCGAILIWTK